MEFSQNLAGKWVAVKKEKAIDTGKSLKALAKRVTKRSDHAQIRFSFVPKGGIAGILYGI